MSIIREKILYNFDLVSRNETISHNNDLRSPNEKRKRVVPNKQRIIYAQRKKKMLYK